eukprot:5694819-Prymnesium_polylepis.1
MGHNCSFVAERPTAYREPYHGSAPSLFEEFRSLSSSSPPRLECLTTSTRLMAPAGSSRIVEHRE